MSSYAKSLDLTLMIDQPPGVNGAPQIGSPYGFVTSGDGAAGGGSVVALDLGTHTAADDTFVGWYVWCTAVAALGNEENLNVWRQITAHSELAGVVTLLVERFPAQTIDGDAFMLVDAVAVQPLVSDDTGGVATDMRSASRNGELDDHWLGSAEEGGPYLEVIEADNNAKNTLRLITDFTQVGGVVAATMGANTAIGDLGEVLCNPEWVEGGFMECSVDQSAGKREQTHGTFLTPPDAMGQRIATGTGVLLFRGPGQARPGSRMEWHRILSSPLDFQEGIGALTVNDPGAGDTTISTSYDAGLAVKGRLFMTSEGSASMCTAVGTPATWSPALRVRCADDTSVYGLINYFEPTDKLLNHHIFLKQMKGDSILQKIWGNVPTLTFSVGLNDFLRMSCAFQGCDWQETTKDNAGSYTRAWRSKRPTVNPVKSAGGRIIIGATEYSLKSASLDLKLQYSLEEDGAAPNGVLGYRFTGIAPSGQLMGKASATNVNFLEMKSSKVEVEPFLIQVGLRYGFPGVFAFWAKKVQLLNATTTDDGGQHGITADWKVCDYDGDASGLPPWMLGIG